MAEPIYKTVRVTNLLLNPSNPRFEPVEYQKEAIEAMIQDQQEKLVVLARHIVQHGLNPSEFIIVKPYGDKQWIVHEGNRRITALKLINEPQLIPANFTRLRKDFQILNDHIDRNLLENIQCVVLSKDDDINEWVHLKHTGQNEGSGVVGWDGQQTSRFRSYTAGKKDMKIVFMDKLKTMEDVPPNIREGLREIKKTNFDRLIGDPAVREILGIHVDEDRLELTNGVNPYLLMALDDLTSDRLSVGKIYHKKDRIAYIDDLKKRHQDDNTGSPQNGKVEIAGTSSDSIKSRRSPSYPIERKTLVPSIHKLTISQARILKIFNELKNIQIDDYPNAAAVLFRVFIELSTDFFMKTKNIANTRVNIDSHLSQKLDAVIEFMQQNGIMTKHELRPMRQMTSSENQEKSVKTFHAYVHNLDVTPLPKDLKTAWDDVWPFIEKIWS